MPAISAGPGSIVLVTGANGFIAVWVVRDLLERGYTVRGAVRSEAKGAYLIELFKRQADEGRFQLAIVPDITKQGAFDDAVRGVSAIAHTASPFHFNADDPRELIDPAVRGTVGILESALKHAPTVRRIVTLSSCAAVGDPSKSGILYESDWNLGDIKEVEERGRDASQNAKYRASKSLAERAAWDFIDVHKEDIPWDLVTLCPPFVFGPVLHEVYSPAALNTSVKDFYDALIAQTKSPEQLASFRGSWVDVRDVSLAHVLALETEAAGGNRFIVAGGNFVWQDWYDVLNDLQIEGLSVPIGMPGSGKDAKFNRTYNTSKARDVLGIVFRDKKTTARDSVSSLVGKFKNVVKHV